MILSFTECIVLAWIYGVDRFYKDIELMIGFKPNNWWKACWSVITPGLILFVLFFSIIIHKPVTYGEDYSYPGWAIGIGWIFALCSLIPLPSIAIYKIWKEEGPIFQRIRKLVHHSEDWGPAEDEDRERYLESLKVSSTNSSSGSLSRLHHEDAEVKEHLNPEKKALQENQSIV